MNDKKDAVNIGVNLSSQLITAVLAMIAVLSTFAAFLLDKRQVGFWYYFISAIAFLCYIISIFKGGKGIDKARKKGYEGDWNLTDTKGLFNWQAILALTGVILFTISVFLGKDKIEVAKKAPEAEWLLKIKFEDSIQEIKITEIQKKYDSLIKVIRNKKEMPSKRKHP
jgi:Ca2+/Na+ antiporter